MALQQARANAEESERRTAEFLAKHKLQTPDNLEDLILDPKFWNLKEQAFDDIRLQQLHKLCTPSLSAQVSTSTTFVPSKYADSSFGITKHEHQSEKTSGQVEEWRIYLPPHPDPLNPKKLLKLTMPSISSQQRNIRGLRPLTRTSAKESRPQTRAFTKHTRSREPYLPKRPRKTPNVQTHRITKRRIKDK